MKGLLRNKKIKLLLGVLCLSFILAGFSSSALAWGPEREKFTMESPATYPTFNSIEDNPTIGNEWDFVRIGEISHEQSTFVNDIEIVPGRQYVVFIYFHNNASSTFNDSAHNNSGIALQTAMSSEFSKVLTPEQGGVVSATISAKNSNPGSVWDEAHMTTSAKKVLLRYVGGSAKIYNDWDTNNTTLPDTLFTKAGTLIGLNGLNGIIPGCEEYHGFVTYVLQAEELNGEIQKTVSKDGKEYKELVNVEPGDEVEFEIKIQNAGDVALTNVVVQDSLPEGTSLVEGSVKLSANDSATSDSLSDNLISGGYNLGTIGTGNTVYIRYKVKVGDRFDCGKKRLTNTAKITYDSDLPSGDSRSDTASVSVLKGGEKWGCEKTVVEPDPEPEPGEEPVLPDDPGTPSELPTTGPAEIALAVIIILGLAAGGIYYYNSRRNLKRVQASVMGGEKSGKDKNISQDE